MEDLSTETENYSNKLKNAESLSGAHEIIFDMVTNLVSKMKIPKSLNTCSTNDNQSRGGDEEYVKLERELQKYEGKVRTHIRVAFFDGLE